MGNSLAESKSSDKEGDTKIIYKKSNAAFYSHSRTVSGVSQSFSRSGILQIKKNLENNHYYEDRGKLKRDLSVETDICILRRYYRGKKNKLSTRDGSAKSKYSTVIDTEIDIIDEFPDMSACGDNDTDNKSSTRLDIASLMIDNLKDLLNQWIQEHLIENKDNKQKIDSVIHTIFDKFDKNKTMTSSSGSTYVLHKETTIHEVKDKKVPSPSFTCYYCKQNIQGVKVRSSSSISQKESSVLAIPFKCKDIRIISTLSIPRSFHKKGIKDQKSHSGSWYKAKKIKHKNIILSIDKSKKVANSSSFDLLAISTKSLLKKYTNYDVHVKKKKRHIVFIPKPLFKSATESSSMTNNEYVQLNTVDINKGQLDDMPSLMKSLFNELEIADNINKHIQNDTKNDNYTMTENESKIVYNVATEKSNDNNIQQSTVDKEAKYEADDGVIVSIDPSQDQQKELANIEQSKSINNSQQTTVKKNYKKTVIRDKFNKHRRLTNKLPKNFKIPKYKNINRKKFSFLYKKANKRVSRRKDFVKYCQNMFEYFEDYNTNKNIKLEIRINVFPMYENRRKDVSTVVSNQALDVYDMKGGSTLLYNVKPTQVSTAENLDEDSIKYHTENESSYGFTPEIVPLLDCAVSQTKYIFDDNAQDKLEQNSKQNSVMERSTLTSELEIVQEISELRAIIKELAAAAEKFVCEQIKKDSNKSNAGTNTSPKISNHFTCRSKVQAVINLRNPSKAIQYSNEVTEKQKLLSGFKLSKEPKLKETFEDYSRLEKKSTSYRVIDSESILRVTDMTSKADEIQNKANNQQNNSTRPLLKKSRSLFELTGDQRNKQKFITLFCDGYQKNLRCNVCSVHKKPSQCSHSSYFRHNRRRNKNWFARKKKERKACDKPKPRPQPRQNHQCPDDTSELTTSEPTTLHRMPSCVCPTINDSEETDDAQMLVPGGNSYRCSSVVVFPSRENEEIEIDDKETATMNEAGTPKVRKVRRGMSFGEGCVYCVLLWIPVIIIACFFFVYVLKDKGTSPLEDGKSTTASQGLVIPVSAPKGNSSSSSVLFVKLRDLGF